MSLKICEKCGETVDEAKAFCPECGNPFVSEEKREDSSEFDRYAGTIKLSKSAFNIMLSKMDLDTSRSPEEEKSRTEQAIENLPEEHKLRDQTKNSGMSKWIIIAAAGAVILIFFVLAVLIALYIYFS